MLAVLFVSAAHAQWNIRITGGAGLSRMNTDLSPVTSRGEFQVVDRCFSWMLAGSATHKVTGRLSFTTGLYWSFIAGHDEYWIQNVKVQEADRRVHYLSLPMMVHVEFGRFRFGAGYQLATPIVASGTFYTYPYANGFGEYSATETKKLGLKHTDIGVVGELGYHISDQIDVGAHYYYGLQDVKDHSDGIRSPLHNEQFVITVGYRVLPKVKAKPSEEVKPLPADQPVE